MMLAVFFVVVVVGEINRETFNQWWNYEVFFVFINEENGVVMEGYTMSLKRSCSDVHLDEVLGTETACAHSTHVDTSGVH
jgi:hypothetical protein